VTANFVTLDHLFKVLDLHSRWPQNYYNKPVGLFTDCQGYSTHIALRNNTGKFLFVLESTVVVIPIKMFYGLNSKPRISSVFYGVCLTESTVVGEQN
jgi:hypothetical protein